MADSSGEVNPTPSLSRRMVPVDLEELYRFRELSYILAWSDIKVP